MDFSIISNAFKFLFDELGSRTKEWFLISTKTALMMFLIAFVGMTLSLLWLSKVVAFFTSVPLIVLLFSLFFGFAYYLIYYVVIFRYIPTCNVLDRLYGRDLQKFSYRFSSYRLILALTLYLALTALGVLLFIIPGVIFAVRFSCVTWILLDKNCGVRQAFAESWKITKGKFWQLCVARFIEMVVITAGPIGLINLFFPIIELFAGSIYKQLVDMHAANDQSSN